MLQNPGLQRNFYAGSHTADLTQQLAQLNTTQQLMQTNASTSPSLAGQVLERKSALSNMLTLLQDATALGLSPLPPPTATSASSPSSPPSSNSTPTSTPALALLQLLDAAFRSPDALSGLGLYTLLAPALSASEALLARVGGLPGLPTCLPTLKSYLRARLTPHVAALKAASMTGVGSGYGATAADSLAFQLAKARVMASASRLHEDAANFTCGLALQVGRAQAGQAGRGRWGVAGGVWQAG